MSEHPRVTYEKDGQNVSVDSSRVVFLLVSDVGAEGVNAAVLRYRKRSDVVPVSLFLPLSSGFWVSVEVLLFLRFFVCVCVVLS